MAFEHFTDPAELAMNLARREAQRWEHSNLRPEHLLLGLLGVEGCRALDVLAGLGVRPDRLRAETERRLGPDRTPELRPLPFTPEAKKVLELAMEEAGALGHHHIGTEHLLLGLIRTGVDAGREFRKLGARIHDARAQMLECLARLGTEPGEQAEHPTGWLDSLRELMRELSREDRRRLREFLEELDREDDDRGQGSTDITGT